MTASVKKKEEVKSERVVDRSIEREDIEKRKKQ